MPPAHSVHTGRRSFCLVRWYRKAAEQGFAEVYPAVSECAYIPYLRWRCWYDRMARRKSILRKAGQ
jgi:hypothetical protein